MGMETLEGDEPALANDRRFSVGSPEQASSSGARELFSFGSNCKRDAWLRLV